MDVIGIVKLKAFWKYYDEFATMYDMRNGNWHKVILKGISEEEIQVLRILEYHYFLINAKTDSEQLVDKYKRVIEDNKHRVTPEVLGYLEKGIKPEIKKTNSSWFHRILKNRL
ncbi:MAG: hypothetical protein ED556_00155 [Winogradskyella sp.]|uniref:hypothetical protein n=1 Tax=Winogradskyella sp. TaxID=1883156 RepID=UPI000F3D0731|nr:hypothetical protein [Winogradskyella sp.]RNC87639.1 MAG: hypothetical protein ED556_00155 [Winogradskyella sp.]